MAVSAYSIVDEIKARLSILDLVQQGLVPVENLHVRGDKATGCCPLHDDRNPSFGFSVSKNLWYCFACAEGGDQIRLYARYQGISDKEAIRRLASYLGLSRTVSPAEQEETGKQAQRRKRERLIEGRLEDKINEVARILTDEFRIRERYLLILQDVGRDPLEDGLACEWLRNRDLIEYWLDQLTFGGAEAKIETLLEVLSCLDL